MSLRDRVAQARNESEKAQPTDAPLIPWALFESYLSNHDLVNATGVAPDKVHDYIVKLHKQALGILPPDPVEECAVPKEMRVTCRYCKSTEPPLTFAKEGSSVCVECGAVVQQNINVEPEYQAPAVTHPNASNTIPGVSNWLVARMRTHDESRSPFMDDLTQWNVYCHLTEDQLAEADRLLRRAYQKEAPLVNVVATLLYVRMRDRLPDEEDLRSQVKSRRRMAEIDCGPPPPSFPCATCDRMHHTHKSARFCCLSRRNNHG